VPKFFILATIEHYFCGCVILENLYLNLLIEDLVDYISRDEELIEMFADGQYFRRSRGNCNQFLFCGAPVNEVITVIDGILSGYKVRVYFAKIIRFF